MKRSSLLICFLLVLINIVRAEPKKVKPSLVPQELKDHFDEKFPKVDPSEWLYDTSCTCYIVRFILKFNECEAQFSKTGKWLQTQTAMDERSVPTPVAVAFKESEFKDWKVLEIMRTETFEVKSCCEYKLKKGKEMYDVLFDFEGKMIRKRKTK